MSDYKEQCWKRYMENMKYERYEKEDLVDEIIEMQGEIERLNNIIKEAREYIEEVETLAMVDKKIIFSISTLKELLNKGE